MIKQLWEMPGQESRIGGPREARSKEKEEIVTDRVLSHLTLKITSKVDIVFPIL